MARIWRSTAILGGMTAVCLFAFSPVVHAATYYVDPTVAGPGGDGSIASPFKNWYQPDFAPGNTYLQRAGTTATGIMDVQALATDQAPVVIGRYGPGSAPVLVGEVIFKFSAYVTIENFEIRDSDGAGVQIQTGCEHIVVQNLRIYHCATGVSIAADAKGDNLVANNVICENDSSGVGVLGGQTSASHLNTISGNMIYRNGLHGVQIRGNYYVVDGNEIHTNGLSGIPGTSGIHIYSPSLGDNSGDFNIVRNNRVSNQQDFDGFDGNGIQSDHFCDNNQIYNNVVFQNDGGGVFLHDARSCSVYGNVLYGNMRDRGSTRQALGEIALTSKFPTLDRVTSNTISGNVVIAVNPDAVPVFVDSLTVDEANAFGGNGFAHEGGGDLWWAVPYRGTDMADWNSFAAGGGNDYAYNPVSAGFVPPSPPPAYMLDTSYTLHSGFFQTILPNTVNFFLGGPGNDVITGQNLADTLVGNGGNDTINGQNGDDWVVGGSGNDILIGSYGLDLVMGGFGDDSIDGGAGDDSLSGGDGVDTMLGAAGDDQMLGGTGNDHLHGGDGEDSLQGGEGDDFLDGGPGEDSDSGGPGNDRIDESGDTLCSINSIFGEDGDDIITGGCGDDGIVGGNGADAIDAGSGNDHIDLSGDTTAQNTANGEDGNDTLIAGDLGDTLRGDAGDDVLVGGPGPDILYEYDDPAGTNNLSGNGGADTIYGGGGPDQINGGAGGDMIDAGLGDDRIYSGSDNDIVLAGGGNDLVSGGTGSDQLHAGDGNDIVLGAAGDDTMSGGAGEDVLDGGSGSDVIDGGDSADVLFDGTGDDRMTGGSGVDNYYFASNSGNDVITDFSSTDVLVVTKGANGTSIDTAADLWSRLTDTADGVVLDLGAGNQVLLQGITVAQISPVQNLFAQNPVELPTMRVLGVPEITHSSENTIVSIPVSLDEGEGIVSMSFSLLFNPGVVDYLGYQPDERIAGWDELEIQEIAGTISFEASGSAPLQSGGEIVWLSFQIRPNPIGSSSPLMFTQAELNDATIPVESIDGAITVGDPPALPLSRASVSAAVVVLVALGALILVRHAPQLK